jgi:pyruvate dehydrogenase E1 component alpha subunit
LDSWLARDPIPSYRERLLGAGVDEETLSQIERSALAAVDLATDEARAAPVPDGSSLQTNLWADGGSSWRN